MADPGGSSGGAGQAPPGAGGPGGPGRRGPGPSAPRALRVRVEDADDLAVLSAYLQDALVPVCDLAYAPEERNFVMVANRFRWERGDAAAPPDAAGGEVPYERVLCGLSFDNVLNVAYRGFHRSDAGRILALLAIRAELGEESGAVYFDFAGGQAIRLIVSRLRCHARDLGEPWPTPWKPEHEPGEPA